MTVIDSINPATGEVEEAVIEATTIQGVQDAAAAAASASRAWDRLGREGRARVLRAIADALEGRREDIVALAMRETALPLPRLNGELTRTCYQARLFADVIEEGSYLGVTIDHAGDTPMGPGPDLRRMLVPLGPVAVFGASNFPLAFSVPGGDTVSALAAGCPVVVKAHDAHPALSRLTFETMRDAAIAAGAPVGTLGIVFGLEAGAKLVQATEIRAVGFTGSLHGGRALLDLVNSRPDPIPFFGELSSINPVVVTPGAIEARATEIADGLVASVTGSAGQLCTKPGLIVVPDDEASDRFVAEVVSRFQASQPFTLLSAGIATTYDHALQELTHQDAVRGLGGSPQGDGYKVPAVVAEIASADLVEHGIDETFGPLAVITRCAPQDVTSLLDHLEGSLTLTVHSEPDEEELLRSIADHGSLKAGRLIHNAWPTGVLVSWAQTHGGPWPSTNTQHTSVGAAAIERFLRPVTWQSMPDQVLPEELRENYSAIPRRIDGQLHVPGATES